MIQQEVLEAAFLAGRRWLDEHLLDDMSHRDLALGQMRAALEEFQRLAIGRQTLPIVVPEDPATKRDRTGRYQFGHGWCDATQRSDENGHAYVEIVYPDGVTRMLLETFDAHKLKPYEAPPTRPPGDIPF